ncbi:MAG: FAD-dependent oxidoreductase, partial [Persicimonas sp.]
MRHIVVLGSGFGGFRAARELQSALSTRRHVRLTVVSKHAHFVYTPLLSEVAGGQLDSSHVTFPLRGEFDKPTDLFVEQVDTIDLEARELRADGHVLDFDYLLVACGSTLDWG